MELCVGRGEGAPGPLRLLGCQFRGSLKESRSGRETTTRLCSGCTVLKFGGYGLVGFRGSVGPMPGAAIWIEFGIGRFGEGAVDLAPLFWGGCPVGSRANQGMTDDYPRTKNQQLFCFDDVGS